MENLRLHFNNAPARGVQTDWPLQTGVLRVVRGDDGRLLVGSAVRGAPLAQVCVDRRGIWLLLADEARGVHVNGRPVRRMAMLRAGDTLHAEGAELLVQADVARALSAKGAKTRAGDETDARVVLRGIGGGHHGRSFPVGEALDIGSGDDCEVRIDGLAARHAELQRMGDQVVLRLRDAKSACLVNGVECRDALLQAGDQIAFAAQRFVLEVPQAGVQEPAPSLPQPATAAAIAAQAARSKARALRWPWLLLAAALLGLALGALLLFGGH